MYSIKFPLSYYYFNIKWNFLVVSRGRFYDVFCDVYSEVWQVFKPLQIIGGEVVTEMPVRPVTVSTVSVSYIDNQKCLSILLNYLRRKFDILQNHLIYDLFSNVMRIFSFHLSNPRGIAPRISGKLCKS